MTTAMKRARRRTGDVLRIDLGAGQSCFARALERPLFEFYDLLGDRVLEVHEIVARPVLFSVWVMDYAVTSGRWPVLGNVALDVVTAVEPQFFKVDSISREVTIYSAGNERPAEPGEWEGLECAAVWDPEHVEDRLRDHFAGRPNKWVQSLLPSIAPPS